MKGRGASQGATAARSTRPTHEAGLEGLTDRELQALCPEQVLARQESWRKRRSDLTRTGVLYDSGERRGRQIVWRVRPMDASGEAALF
jgi:hypothetical protein